MYARAGRAGGGHGGFGLRTMAGNVRLTLSQLSHSSSTLTRTMVSINPFQSMVILIISRRVVVPGIHIQRKYGRQQVHWTKLRHFVSTLIHLLHHRWLVDKTIKLEGKYRYSVRRDTWGVIWCLDCQR